MLSEGNSLVCRGLTVFGSGTQRGDLHWKPEMVGRVGLWHVSRREGNDLVQEGVFFLDTPRDRSRDTDTNFQAEAGQPQRGCSLKCHGWRPSRRLFQREGGGGAPK